MGDLFDDLSDQESIPLAEFAERSYLEYAMSVVTGRALPDVADGQKPVQRRILYAMHELGLYSPARHVKSARVVGDVLGKYHPHGDVAAYDALVRQAQDFTLRYPLIDGQGNFGSRDGDNAAAMRYTECRLTPIAVLLLSEIEQDTVDFAPNYDGAFKEPKLLPARLPMLLANGASGIGVGMATDIPPHNLRELASAVVATIRDPKIDLAQLLQHIKGPDLPGGGRIISSPDDIRAVYESGRGSLRVRARWTVEELARGQWRVAVTVARAEVALAVDQRVAQREALRHAHQRLVGRLVAVRVELAEHVADHARALHRLGVGRQAHLAHREQDATLYRLLAVADVGQRAALDDRDGVVEVGALREAGERQRFAGVGGVGEEGLLFGHASRLDRRRQAAAMLTDGRPAPCGRHGHKP